MGRQYLNVLFTPTIAFKGHTEGLCGVMDNDPSNDLRGPSGEQYSDPIKFADSCKWNALPLKLLSQNRLAVQFLRQGKFPIAKWDGDDT